MSRKDDRLSTTSRWALGFSTRVVSHLGGRVKSRRRGSVVDPFILPIDECIYTTRKTEKCILIN